MSVFPKLIHWLNEFPIKIPKRVFIFVFGFFLVDVDKLNLKFLCKGTGARIAKIVLKKEKKVGDITLSDEKVCCIPQ